MIPLPKENTGTGKEVNYLPFGMITTNVIIGSWGDVLLEIRDIAKNFSYMLLKKEKKKKTQIFVSWDRGQSIE